MMCLKRRYDIGILHYYYFSNIADI